MKPRMLLTLDEEGALLPAQVRVGQAVDVVAQAGRPKTITGFQVGLLDDQQGPSITSHVVSSVIEPSQRPTAHHATFPRIITNRPLQPPKSTPQTHTTPVLLNAGERAELATEQYLPASSLLEGVVLLKKNPDYMDTAE
jgi:26S proteasome regulatory subunit N1